MRQILTTFSLCIACILVQDASAQSTISNEPLELLFGKAAWGVMLPTYELGTTTDGRSAFQDDLDNLGALWELKAVRRFLGTRTSFETKAFYGLVLANASAGPIGMDIPNPASGVITALGPDSTHLDSNLGHYGVDLVLRDTWRTRFGGLSAGSGFSYMAFDQEFKADYGGVRLLDENLDSDFVGGKTFVGWDGLLCGRCSNLDIVVGYYGMDAEYRFTGGTIAGASSDDLSKKVTTVEAIFTTRTELGGYQAGLTFGAMYISDMPLIQHNVAVPVTLDTDDAVTIKAMVEILL